MKTTIRSIADSYKKSGNVKRYPNPRYKNLHNALVNLDFVADEPVFLRAHDRTLGQVDYAQFPDDCFAVAQLVAGTLQSPLSPSALGSGYDVTNLETKADFNNADTATKELEATTFRGQDHKDFDVYTKYTVLREQLDFVVKNHRPFALLFGIYAEVGDITVNDESYDGTAFGYPAVGSLVEAPGSGRVNNEWLKALPNCKTWVIPPAERPPHNEKMAAVDPTAPGTVSYDYATNSPANYQRLLQTNPPKPGTRRIKFNLELADMIEKLTTEHTGLNVNLQFLQGTWSTTLASITSPAYCTPALASMPTEGIRLHLFCTPLDMSHNTLGTTSVSDDQYARLAFSTHNVSKRAVCIDCSLHDFTLRKEVLLTDPKNIQSHGIDKYVDVATL